MTTGRRPLKVLIVEGQSDLRVVPFLFERAGVSWPKGNEPVDVREPGGFDGMVKEGYLGSQWKQSGMAALGIIADADTDPQARWNALRARLLPLRPDVPVSLPTDGLYLAGVNGPSLGVWIMPENGPAGMLESLLLKARGGPADVWELATRAVNEARAAGAPWRDPHRHKAELHSWLAWQDPPGRQMHEAARDNLLRPDEPSLMRLTDWFRRVFDIPASAP